MPGSDPSMQMACACGTTPVVELSEIATIERGAVLICVNTVRDEVIMLVEFACVSAGATVIPLGLQ